jgi:hypothetical protein
MKKIFLSAAAALAFTGCESYHTVGTGDYGFTYDLNLPVISGSQADIVTAATAPEPAYASLAPAPGTQGPPPQSITFYEGTEPQRQLVVTPAPGGPVGVGTASVGAAPIVTTPAPAVNEPAGAAAGTAAGPGVAEGAAVAPGVAQSPFLVGDGGGVILPATNAVTQGTNGNGIVINNTNGNNIVLTNGTSLTNATNGNIALTNGNPSTNGFVTTNFINTPTNTGVSPVAGATNNLNSLPRATGPTVGTPPGTALVPNRPIGEPAGAQISPNPNIPAGAITPSAPTQPGPTTTTTTQTSSGTQTTQIPQVNVGGALNSTPVTVPGTTPNRTAPTPQQRTLMNSRQSAPVPAAPTTKP